MKRGLLDCVTDGRTAFEKRGVGSLLLYAEQGLATPFFVWARPVGDSPFLMERGIEM